jgi:hypothetical protein
MKSYHILFKKNPSDLFAEGLNVQVSEDLPEIYAINEAMIEAEKSLSEYPNYIILAIYRTDCNLKSYG